jgi:Predicted ATPase (AAA+ superfamily)
VKESVSLSDRFGLWLGFHSCDQPTYLKMIDAYADYFGLKMERETLHHQALEWATTRGSRSGRVAWQFMQSRAS